MFAVPLYEFQKKKTERESEGESEEDKQRHCPCLRINFKCHLPDLALIFPILCKCISFLLFFLAPVSVSDDQANFAGLSRCVFEILS